LIEDETKLKEFIDVFLAIDEECESCPISKRCSYNFYNEQPDCKTEILKYLTETKD
jgi:hypothetical protein